MSRPPRIDFAGARHHVFNRGARKQPIYLGKAARESFLDLLAEFPERFHVRVHGYALMSNHYHLLLESVSGTLPVAMQQLNGQFSKTLNWRFGWDGPIWRGRYANRIVEDEVYWRHLLAYVHLNPERAGLCGELHDPLWTSHSAYVSADGPPWLTTDEQLGLVGGVSGYRQYLAEVRAGDRATPEGFDEVVEWRFPPSARARPLRRASTEKLGLEAAMHHAALVVGIEPHLLSGNARDEAVRARAVVTWWLTRATCETIAGVAAFLECHPSTVSKRIRRVDALQRDDDRLRGWMDALTQLHPLAGERSP